MARWKASSPSFASTPRTWWSSAPAATSRARPCGSAAARSWSSRRDRGSGVRSSFFEISENAFLCPHGYGNPKNEDLTPLRVPLRVQLAVGLGVEEDPPDVIAGLEE